MHSGTPLKIGSEVVANGLALAVNSPPKLALVSIDVETTVRQAGPESEKALQTFIRALLKSMHPLGAVAFSIPRPWFTHLERIYGTIQCACKYV